jgi:hypothetical protein
MRSFDNDGYGQFMYNQPVQRTSSQGNCGISPQNMSGGIGQYGCGQPFYVQNDSNLYAQNECGQSGNALAGQSGCQELYLAPDGTICRNGEPLNQNYNGCNVCASGQQAAAASGGNLGRGMYQCITPAFFNAIYNGGNQDVAPEGEVCFMLSYQTGDFQFAPNSPMITCNTPGIYRVEYALTLRPTVGQINAAYAVSICGEEHPFSCFGCYADGLGDEERQELYGFFLTNLAAGETLVLKNKSNTCNHLSSCIPASQTINRASILIQRIA